MSSTFRRITPMVSGSELPAIYRRPTSWFAYVYLPNGSIAKVPRLALRLAPQSAVGKLLAQPSVTPGDECLPVTVVPQSHCNARCGYCINNVHSIGGEVERIPAILMNSAVIRHVAAFIEAQRVRKGLDSVEVMLFGGEPLLNPDRCYELLDAIQHVRAVHLTTNGTYLTAGVARELTLRRTTTVQVTFDGCRKDHDQVRHLATGGGTYDTIIGNLRELDQHPELLPNRSLRVNVTQANLDGLPELIEDLARTLDSAQYLLYFALVDDNGIGWEGGLTPADARARLDDLAVMAAWRGFKPFTSAPPAGHDCGYCTGEFGDGGMVIGPDGQLYSCWDTMGHSDMVVGNVWKGYAARETHAERWLHCGDDSRNNSRRELPTLDTRVAPSTWAVLEYQVARLTSARVCSN